MALLLLALLRLLHASAHTGHPPLTNILRCSLLAAASSSRDDASILKDKFVIIWHWREFHKNPDKRNLPNATAIL
jgi:hypothetical protein